MMQTTKTVYLEHIEPILIRRQTSLLHKSLIRKDLRTFVTRTEKRKEGRKETRAFMHIK